MIIHNRTPINILLTMLSLTGIIALFLPFTWNVTPLMAVFNSDFNTFGIAFIASPMLLTILISAMSIHLLISGNLSKYEIYVAYGVILLVVSLTLAGMIMNFSLPVDVKSWIGVALWFIGYLSGIITFLRYRHMPELKSVLIILLIQIFYISHMSGYLVSFYKTDFGGWQIGAYFTLFTVIIYTIHIIYNLNFNISKYMGNNAL